MLSQRSRQQRRSACNRCRTYKLRCERDPRQADGVCERCRKSGAACITTTTTTTAATASAVAGSPNSTGVDANKGFGTGARPPIRLAPAPRGASSSHNVSRPMHQTQPAGGTANVGRTESPSSTLVRSPPFDFNFSCFAPSDESPGVRTGPNKPSVVDWQEHFTCTESCIDVAVFDDSYMDLVHPEADSSSQGAVLANSIDPETPSPGQSVDSAPGSLATSSSHTQVAGPDDLYMDLVSTRGPEDAVGVDMSHNCLSEVLELSSRLAEDHESLQTADVYPPYSKTAPNPVETAVQRALERSSHLCELIKSIGARRHSSSLTTSRTGCDPHYRGQGPACCIVLTTSLVTAYILLVRVWRRIFVHLRRLLLDSTPSSPVRSADVGGGGLAIMPSLQLGGFRVQGSPVTQVSVLMELSFDMLARIETGLGAGCWGVSKASQGRAAVQLGQPACIIQGPVATSVRDMLLTQEMTRLGQGPEGIDSLPLCDLAGELKSRLST